jgi:O-antigen/teichoic acid export membrane protein
VATQLNGAIYMFLSNFQTAFNPQIVKSYAQHDKDYLHDFVIKTSKYSYMLMFFIILPFLVNVDTVMKLWLGKVPTLAAEFTIHLCIYTLLDALSGPLWMLVEAEGNIRNYQIVSSLSGFIILPVTYLCYQFGLPAYSGNIVRNINYVIFIVWRMYYLKKRVDFPVNKYYKEVLPRIALVSVLGLIPVYLVKHMIAGEFLSLLVSCVVSVVVLAILYLTIGIGSEERKFVFSFIRKKLGKESS